MIWNEKIESAWRKEMRANVGLKPDNPEKCISVLRQHSIELVKASYLNRI